MQKNIKMQLHNRIKNSLEKFIFIMGVFVVVLISGCGYDNYKTETTPVEQEDTINYSILLPGTYDSKDTAVFISKNFTLPFSVPCCTQLHSTRLNTKHTNVICFTLFCSPY